MDSEQAGPLPEEYIHTYFGFFFLSFFVSFFSSNNLSRRTLDVYHASTNGVVLVRIYDAGLKPCCTRLAEIQDAKK